MFIFLLYLLKEIPICLCVEQELTEFTGLQILYLHGNQIQDPAQIDQLVTIKTLRKLTLHGNPVENVKVSLFVQTLRK